jgi:hypothetical protein
VCVALRQGPDMELAQIGPLTATVEAFATAVGAGILLGSFVFGVGRIFFRQPRQVRENRVLMDGYAGGLSTVVLAIADTLIR